MSFEVKNEYLATKCDTCHQSDMFDAVTDHCQRCSTTILEKFDSPKVPVKIRQSQAKIDALISASLEMIRRSRVEQFRKTANTIALRAHTELGLNTGVNEDDYPVSRFYVYKKVKWLHFFFKKERLCSIYILKRITNVLECTIFDTSVIKIVEEELQKVAVLICAVGSEIIKDF